MRRIVVIGGGVAGLTAAWALHRRGIEPMLLERARRVGGSIETERTAEGLLVEYGPDAILGSKPGARALLDGLGLAQQVLSDGPAPRRSFVAVDDTLRPLPEGLAGLVPRSTWSLATSSCLGLRARLRAFAEPFVPEPEPEADESVAAFVDRRLGVGFRRSLVDPLLRGVYGVTSERLGMAATLPHLRAMVQAHGSLGAALLRAPDERQPARLLTLRRGMATIVAALARECRIALGTCVTSLRRTRSGVRIDTDRGVLEADAVVLATAPWDAAPLLDDAELRDELAAIEHVGAEVVSLAYPRASVASPLAGTGHVVADARRACRAVTWCSAKWPDRAPADVALFRAVLDPVPARDPDVIALARSEIEPLLGIDGAPVHVALRRLPRALPVPGVGHLARRARLLAWCEQSGAIRLAASALGTVGVPDAAHSALRAASALVP